MAITLSTALRNSRADQITAAAGSLAKLRIYTAGYAAQLVELVCNATFSPAASGGVLTLNSIATGFVTATGTAAIARILKADGTTLVVEGLSVAVSGANVNLTNLSLAVNDSVTISLATITEGNP